MVHTYAKIKRLLVAATAMILSRGCHDACSIFLPKSTGSTSSLLPLRPKVSLFFADPNRFALKALLSAWSGISSRVSRLYMEKLLLYEPVMTLLKTCLSTNTQTIDLKLTFHPHWTCTRICQKCSHFRTNHTDCFVDCHWCWLFAQAYSPCWCPKSWVSSNPEPECNGHQG